MQIIISYYKSPFGELIIGSYENKICICDWKYRKMRPAIDQRIQKGLKTTYQEGTSAAINTCKIQLKEYVDGERSAFDLPLLLVGTDFQKEVWNALLMIPYGKTETYLGLSKKLGNEKAIRAVATANGANAISIIVPCHRVIGIDGDLVGYAGGLLAKKKLLLLEGALKEANQLELGL